MIRTVVVDDDYRVASIHAAYVGKVEGFEVIAQVHSAAAAVEAVIRPRPDLLLLDLYLPHGHGLDLAARLRRYGVSGRPEHGYRWAPSQGEGNGDVSGAQGRPASRRAAAAAQVLPKPQWR
jgi:CheY-like chemotaxis protein